jgi:beta-glucosidase
LGRYPEDGLALFGRDMPPLQAGDMGTICQPLDFLGANVYTGYQIRAGVDGQPEIVQVESPEPLTMLGLPVTPEVLYWVPRFFYERYGLPVVVTENGMAGTEWMLENGTVPDPHRIDFHNRYLRACARAVAEGIPVRGYFAWSLMDNFEWSQGFKPRYGLIYVDYQTQTRTLKDSARWYREVIRSNGAALGPR